MCFTRALRVSVVAEFSGRRRFDPSVPTAVGFPFNILWVNEEAFLSTSLSRQSGLSHTLFVPSVVFRIGFSSFSYRSMHGGCRSSHFSNHLIPLGLTHFREDFSGRATAVRAAHVVSLGNDCAPIRHELMFKNNVKSGRRGNEHLPLERLIPIFAHGSM